MFFLINQSVLMSRFYDIKNIIRKFFVIKMSKNYKFLNANTAASFLQFLLLCTVFKHSFAYAF